MTEKPKWLMQVGHTHDEIVLTIPFQGEYVALSEEAAKALIIGITEALEHLKHTKSAKAN